MLSYSASMKCSALYFFYSISCHNYNSCFFFGCSCSLIEVGKFSFVKNFKYYNVKYKLKWFYFQIYFMVRLFTTLSFLLYSSLKSSILFLLVQMHFCVSSDLGIDFFHYHVLIATRSILLSGQEKYSVLLLLLVFYHLLSFCINFKYPAWLTFSYPYCFLFADHFHIYTEAKLIFLMLCLCIMSLKNCLLGPIIFNV